MIRVENLTKFFGVFSALCGIDLLINSGEFWIIVGPNGAGKTTLLKIIATLSHPTSGAIEINQTDLQRAKLQIRKQIGFIGHQNFLYDNLTAEENLKFYDIDIADIPIVFQYNKRDLAMEGIPILDVETMEKDLNAQLKAPSFTASALKGDNVVPTVKKAISTTIVAIREKLL